jgi:hypothetical protein
MVNPDLKNSKVVGICCQESLLKELGEELGTRKTRRQEFEMGARERVPTRWDQAYLGDSALYA